MMVRTGTHDNWERLVAATLRRQELWELCHAHSREPSVSTLASSHDLSFRSPFQDFDHASSTSWYPQHSIFGVEASRWGYDAHGSEVEAAATVENSLVLKPEEVFVNGQPLSIKELTVLQSCPNPPKRLKPGKYWYDKHAGFWGKQGQKPSQIVSTNLNVGGYIDPNASNGNTLVFINGREITRVELRLLKLIRVQCSRDTHFWMYEDGSYQHEAGNRVWGSIWHKAGAKLLCSVLSLPFPSKSSNTSGEQSVPGNIVVKDVQKLLLIGYDGSGTSTIFKQALFLYKDMPFLEDELENIKLLIQSHIFHYICMLEEVHGHFDVENPNQLRRNQSVDGRVDTGNGHSISNSLIEEYAPLVEKLWRDPAFRETVKQRSQSVTLPSVANYFLRRVADIFKPDYLPSRMDILRAEDFPSSLSFMDFSLTQLQDDEIDSGDQQTVLRRYQLIRPPTKGFGDDEWIEMFEGVGIVIFCISLTDYDQIVVDDNGDVVNKMMVGKKLFEGTVTHPPFEQMSFLLLLTKYDLFEEKIKQVPLNVCDWLHDFDPVKLSNGTVSQLEQKGFEYISVKFKRLYATLTGRKLYVTQVNSLEKDSVGAALKYAREILKWDEEMNGYFWSESDYSSLESFNSDEDN